MMGRAFPETEEEQVRLLKRRFPDMFDALDLFAELSEQIDPQQLGLNPVEITPREELEADEDPDVDERYNRTLHRAVDFLESYHSADDDAIAEMRAFVDRTERGDDPTIGDMFEECGLDPADFGIEAEAEPEAEAERGDRE